MLKRKHKLIIILLVIELAALPVFFGLLPTIQPFGMPLDIDYISEGQYTGNYLMSDNGGKVTIVNDHLEVLWQSDIPEVFVHEAELLPDGDVIVCDTAGERVYEIDIDDPSRIEWEWNPKKISDVNWTAVGNSWGWKESALDYVQSQEYREVDWTHINDAEWVNGSRKGRDYDSILISMRNFDMIVEVNYSQTKEIIWYYGEPLQKSKLNHQHNVDIRDNGNVIICDSENHRIVEIDYETKEVVWEYAPEFPEGELRWARDCDDIGNGTYMITDSNNGRVFFLDRDTKEILVEYGKDFLVQPYESDLVMIDGQERILVGDSPATAITIINPADGSFKHLGFSFIANYIRFTVGLIVVYYGFMFAIAYQEAEGDDITSKLKKHKVYKELINLAMIFTIFWFLGTFYRFLIEFGLFPVMDRITWILARPST
jgi:hypothetical protein